MSSQTEYYRWTTRDELAFVRGLGFHRLALTRRPAPTAAERIDLMFRYLHALGRRVEWGLIDREDLLNGVAKMIRQLETGDPLPPLADLEDEAAA